MAVSDLPILGLLKTRMRWHQARQGVLAHNVANADTPGFRPSDLKPMGSDASFRKPGLTPVVTQRTHKAHLLGTPMGQGSSFRNGVTKGWETTSAGNAVVLEEQMIKVSENQFDFQLATTLYARSLGLLKTAIGRGT
ncbi:MAG: flagellar basal body rod protein FlgB [Proteobacteria bacterium]|nr:flagellar basal body rod protein FlgB [Pseudomonadota bacterium]